jgi:hypothetical protein
MASSVAEVTLTEADSTNRILHNCCEHPLITNNVILCRAAQCYFYCCTPSGRATRHSEIGRRRSEGRESADRCLSINGPLPPTPRRLRSWSPHRIRNEKGALWPGYNAPVPSGARDLWSVNER